MQQATKLGVGLYEYRTHIIASAVEGDKRGYRVVASGGPLYSGVPEAMRAIDRMV